MFARCVILLAIHKHVVAQRTTPNVGSRTHMRCPECHARPPRTHKHKRSRTPPPHATPRRVIPPQPRTHTHAFNNRVPCPCHRHAPPKPHTSPSSQSPKDCPHKARSTGVKEMYNLSHVQPVKCPPVSPARPHSPSPQYNWNYTLTHAT